MIAPYWTSPDGAIVVYNARFEDVLAAGLVPVREVALIHDDPPYGIALDTRARGGAGNRVGKGSHRSKARGWPPIAGDDAPFDASPLLALARPSVIWGGHLCEPALPRSPSWIVWDKRDGAAPDNSGDCKMAWSNLGGPIREFRHVWRGLCRASECGGGGGSPAHLHPTQKPIALSSWVFERAKLTPGSLVFVPHGGSGPDLPACVAAGLHLIWCDVEAWCCDVAIARLACAPIDVVARVKARQSAHAVVTPERAAEPAGPLFGGAR